MEIVEQDGTLRRQPPDRPRRPTAPCTASPGAWSRTWSRASPTASRSGSRSRASATARSSPGKALELSVGYSHPVTIQAPDGIEFEVPQPTQVIVRGIDKQLVGEIAVADPPRAPARALQGQGHPLRGRARPPQGRKAGIGMTRHHQAPAAPAPPPARAGEDPRHRRAAAALRLPLQPRRVRAADRRPQRHHGRRRLPGSSPSCASSTPMDQAKRVGELLAERAKAAGVEPLRLRPRRLPLPRPGQRARRGRPRGRPGVLSSLP